MTGSKYLTTVHQVHVKLYFVQVNKSFQWKTRPQNQSNYFKCLFVVDERMSCLRWFCSTFDDHSWWQERENTVIKQNKNKLLWQPQTYFIHMDVFSQRQKRETNNFKVSLVHYNQIVLSTTGTVFSISWFSTSKIKAPPNFSVLPIDKSNKQTNKQTKLCGESKLSRVKEGRAHTRETWYGLNHGEWRETKLITTKSSCPQLNLLSTAVHHDKQWREREHSSGCLRWDSGVLQTLMGFSGLARQLNSK